VLPMSEDGNGVLNDHIPTGTQDCTAKP